MATVRIVATAVDAILASIFLWVPLTTAVFDATFFRARDGRDFFESWIVSLTIGERINGPEHWLRAWRR